MIFRDKEKASSGPLPKSSRRQKPTPPAMKFLNLAVLLLVGFAMYQVIGSEEPPDAAPENPSLAAVEQVPEVEHEGDPRIDRIVHRHEIGGLSRLIPVGRPMPEMQTLRAGSGPRTFCGQQVTYRLRDVANPEAEMGEPQQLRLGADPRQVGLALGMLGMRAGEIRAVNIPADPWMMITLGQQAPITRQVVVELLSLEETAPSSPMALRRFLRQSGGGEYLRCGDMALLRLAIWDTNGTLLFSNLEDKPLYFIAGEGRVPFGLEQAVLEMAAGSEYSFVIPPEMTAPFNPQAEPSAVPEAFDAQPWPQDLVFPPDRALLVDVYYPAEAPLRPPVPDTTTAPLPTDNQ